MSSTATSTCPSFCISPPNGHDEIGPDHLDQMTFVPSFQGNGRVNIEQVGDLTLISVDDRAYTAAQADALIDAIARRIDALAVTR